MMGKRERDSEASRRPRFRSQSLGPPPASTFCELALQYSPLRQGATASAERIRPGVDRSPQPPVCAIVFPPAMKSRQDLRSETASLINNGDRGCRDGTPSVGATNRLRRAPKKRRTLVIGLRGDGLPGPRQP